MQMIRFVRGNLFDTSANALVNTVNCAGIMGKGIAYQFKRAYPAYFSDYERRCKRNEVRIGEVYAYQDSAKLIISFPTKKHWKSNSRLEDVDAGLASLRELLLREGITKVAVPPLGCGNGGLSWTDVRPLIESRLSDLPAVDVEVFEPSGSFGANVAVEPRVSLSHFVLVALRVRLTNPNRLAIQKAAYMFNVFAEADYFRFTEYKLGPYCAAIEPMVNAIRDYLDFHKVSPEEMLTDGMHRRLSGADGDRLAQWESAIAQAAGFCNRHATDIEALATVHAVLRRDGSLSLAETTSRFLAWSTEKAERFSASDVAAAVAALEAEGLVERTLFGFAVCAPGAPKHGDDAIALAVPDDLKRELGRLAQRSGLTADVVLRRAVEQYLVAQGARTSSAGQRSR
jgi:O-acetyl-ADP-ribose deacetylase (regulator of RNase III)